MAQQCKKVGEIIFSVSYAKKIHIYYLRGIFWEIAIDAMHIHKNVYMHMHM